MRKAYARQMRQSIVHSYTREEFFMRWEKREKIELFDFPTNVISPSWYP